MEGRTGRSDFLQLYHELSQAGTEYLMYTSLQEQQQQNRGRADASCTRGGASSSVMRNSTCDECRISRPPQNVCRKVGAFAKSTRSSISPVMGEETPEHSADDKRCSQDRSDYGDGWRRAPSMGLVETGHGSASTGMQLLDVLKQNGGPSDSSLRPFNGVPGGVLDPRACSFFRSSGSLPSSSVLVGWRSFFCWLCETPCVVPGWLNAPELYHSAVNANITGRPFPVSLLTLCTRCSVACSLPADAPPEVVLRRAGATRARLRRSEMFVTAVREYKLLLEVLAANATVVAKRGCTAHARDFGSSFWDLPVDVQQNMVSQLTEMLATTLRLNLLVSQGDHCDVLTEDENNRLEEELMWMRQHFAHRNDVMQLEERTLLTPGLCCCCCCCGGGGGGNNRSNSNDSQDLSGHAHASPSQMNATVSRGLSRGDHSSARTAMATQQTALIHSSPSQMTELRHQQQQQEEEEEQQQQQQQDLVALGEKRCLKALDCMLERAFILKLQEGGDGAEIPAVGTVAVAAAGCSDGDRESRHATSSSAILKKDADEILMQYFEGRLKDLPRFKVLSATALAGGAKCSDTLQLLRSVSSPFAVSPRGGSSCLNAEGDVSGDAVLVAADAIDATTMNAAGLLERLREEQRRRTEAEDALRESQRKIVALEKVTDHMSELILQHRLNSIVAHHFCTMQQLLRTVTQRCVDITMQKSLLFADEASALMRQVQRRVYGVPMRFPLREVDPVALATAIIATTTTSANADGATGCSGSCRGVALHRKDVVVPMDARADLAMNGTRHGDDGDAKRGGRPAATLPPPKDFPPLLELKPLVRVVVDPAA